MVRVRDTTVYRTNLGTLGAFIETNTLGALLGVDNVDCLSLADCVIGALRFTSPTANAILRNLIRHKRMPPSYPGNFPFIISFTARY
jgi:hypothetical protein